MNTTNPEILSASDAIRRIPIVECGERLIDIRATGGIAFGPAPDCPETAPEYTWVRESVIKRLQAAQSSLPPGLKIRLYEGFRSLTVQALLFAEEQARVIKRNPNLSPKEAFQETTRLVSPVELLDGTSNVPPHNTGGAVDVELVDGSGQVIDFGMKIREWASVAPALCKTEGAEISEAARVNRELLLHSMEQAGFVNYSEEWWHFSYGDRHWAFLSGQKAAIFGRVGDKKRVAATAKRR